MTTYDLSQLSPYERQAWDAVQRWRRTQVHRRSRVPAPAREQARQIGKSAAKAWKATPGNAQLNEVVNKVLEAGNEAVTDAWRRPCVEIGFCRQHSVLAAQSTNSPTCEPWTFESSTTFVRV